MRKSMFALILGIYAVCAYGLLAAPGQAAPPETLTLQDLVNRPDRWPATVTVGHDLVFPGGQRIHQGQSAHVIGVTDAVVQADAGGSLLVQLRPSDCDLLAAANQAWSALTPAQRAVDPVSLSQDVTLWPATVQAAMTIPFNDGKRAPAGTEFGLTGIDGDQVRLMDETDHTMYKIPEGFTDVFARARALALIDPAKRPSRIADALRNVLVGADGAPHQSHALDDSQVFVLYYGASWCPPCRQFTPGFASYIRHAEAGNPHMSVTMVSDDKDESKMREYMTEEQMPWPAVPYAALKQSSLLMGYLKSAIPTVVIVDRFGRVLFENWNGDQYLDPNTAIPALSQLLQSGAAR